MAKTGADVRLEQLDKDQNILDTDYYLNNDKLLDILCDEVQANVAGEYDTIKTINLIIHGGRLVENSDPVSKNLAVNDSSGAGKDFILKQCLKYVQDDKKVCVKRISEKVLTYYNNKKFNPDWTWDGKVFYNEDISSSVLNSDVFKVLCSSDGVNKSIVLINQLPVEIIVNGKPVILVSFAMSTPKQELLRRFPFITLNTTPEQTRNILYFKAKQHAYNYKNIVDEFLVDALFKLKSCNVVVPFAETIINFLDTNNIILRSHYDRLIDYIKFSAAIHQANREKFIDLNMNENIIATYEDYENARVAMIKTTSNIYCTPLTKEEQLLLSIFEKLSSNDNLCFSATDLEPHVTFRGFKWIYKTLNKLANIGLLRKSQQDRSESRRPVMVYSMISDYRINIPDKDDLVNAGE